MTGPLESAARDNESPSDVVAVRSGLWVERPVRLGPVTPASRE